MIPKNPRRRDRNWLQAVAELETCVLCEKWGVQVAHRDEGKGMGMKNHDHLVAALCPECHYKLGNGRDLSRDDRRAMMDRAIVRTFDRLVQAGMVGLT